MAVNIRGEIREISKVMFGEEAREPIISALIKLNSAASADINIEIKTVRSDIYGSLIVSAISSAIVKIFNALSITYDPSEIPYVIYENDGLMLRNNIKETLLYAQNKINDHL